MPRIVGCWPIGGGGPLLGLVAGAVLLATVLATAAQAGDRPSCADAIAAAERKWRIPAGYLEMVARHESGLSPFALNIEGSAFQPATAVEAAALVLDAYRAGARQVDVGCGQISLRHHPQAFRTLGEAFDPVANADYAGRHLRLLFDRHGTWTAAIQLYHSGDPLHAKAYLCRVWASGGRERFGIEADAEMRTFCR